MTAIMVADHPTPGDTALCPNCSAPLKGPYCSDCGQRQTDLDRPFRDIAGEAMESFLSFDARILRTVWPLVRRPGLLTVDFLAGRRARYVHPFKLYFAASVLHDRGGNDRYFGNTSCNGGSLTNSAERPVIGAEHQKASARGVGTALVPGLYIRHRLHTRLDLLRAAAAAALPAVLLRQE